MRFLARRLLPPRLRTMRQFAEQEIILPSGPYEGETFSVDRQPFARLWLDALDSGRWQRYACTAPSQSGKTLLGSLVPLLYHLFEIVERVVFGLPDMDMALDKWRDDILPVIERTRYRALLPKSGGGSRGGRVRAVKFRNGAVLRFMSAGGGDKSRAGYTSRVLIVTEVDGFDASSITSREADKIKQLEARTRAYSSGLRRRTYLECTVSTEEGRIWQEYTHGTASRIILPCPHCAAWVSPEREHLLGWQDAESEIEARQKALFHCPQCGKPWTEEQRHTANLQCRLVHRGQEVHPDGQIVGSEPLCDTFGFRWSAVNNTFATSGDAALDEWRGVRAANEDNAQRELQQFVWCIPYAPPKLENAPLSSEAVRQRFGHDRRGFVPAETAHLTVAVDLGLRVCWYMAVAWRADATGHVVDYGTIEVRSDDLGLERGLMAALRDFRDSTILKGWASSDGGALRVPDRVLIDSGWGDSTATVYAFCRESTVRFLPAVGRGVGQRFARRYSRPTKTGSTVQLVGEDYHVAFLPKQSVFLVETNADYWKSWCHNRLRVAVGEPGGLSFFQSPNKNEHITLAKHLTAETQVEEFLPGKGTVIRWESRHRANHLLDCAYMNCAAGHLCGARLLPTPEQKRRPAKPRPAFSMPDGQPFLVTERS